MEAEIIFWAFIASFFGSIAPGVIAITSVHITRERGMVQGVLFALLSALLEMLHIWPALWLAGRIYAHASLLLWLEIAAVVFFLALAWVAWNNKEGKKSKVHPTLNWYSGLTVNILNPAAIPYWLFISGQLHSFGVLPFTFSKLWFGIAACTGTAGALMLYVLYAGKLLQVVQKPAIPIHKILAILLFLLAINQGIRIAMLYL
jgi:threonine/homoserine/homoserine lactone efflux protein